MTGTGDDRLAEGPGGEGSPSGGPAREQPARLGWGLSALGAITWMCDAWSLIERKHTFMTVRVAINGFGQTGRSTLRAVLDTKHDVEVVAVNDLGAPAAMVGLLARDSVFGRLNQPFAYRDGKLEVGGQSVRFLSHKDPTSLPWKELDVDVVVESTGRFRRREQAAAHLAAGAGRVIISAPGKGVDATFVIGVNDHEFDPRRHQIVSNASCTTNCLAPMIKVLDELAGVEQGFITTVHAYTGDQALVDGPHTDPRRARAAAVNIVPTRRLDHGDRGACFSGARTPSHDAGACRSARVRQVHSTPRSERRSCAGEGARGEPGRWRGGRTPRSPSPGRSSPGRYGRGLPRRASPRPPPLR
jgi:hypothetical protein